MIGNKKKHCKGTNKAKDSGCGNDCYPFKFGLCSQCFKEWLFTTNNGNEYLDRVTIKAKKEVRVKKKKETKEKKIQLMTADKYRAVYVQPKINLISRLIDYELPCISSGNYGKMNGGHFWSVGGHRSIALNLHNIHRQSFEANHYKSGDEINYMEGLIQEYGINYFRFIERLKMVRPLKLSLEDMRRIHVLAAAIAQEIEPIQRKPLERLKLRNEVNTRLGIYTDAFCVYKKV